MWGNNGHGQLGFGHQIHRCHPTSFKSPDFRWNNFAFGYDHSIGITDQNEIFVWGKNSNGQLGLGHTTSQSDPCALSLPDTVVISVVAGGDHTILLTSLGAMVCGKNNHGQLGLGHRKDQLSFQILPSPSDHPWESFFCGFNHSIGLSSGEAFVWGQNSDGQLGLGHTNDETSPQLLRAPLTSHWTSFSCGYYFTIGLTSNGDAYVWGRNSSGQLGLGHRKLQFSPEPLRCPSSSWSFFACGGDHSVGVNLKGEAFVWGSNRFGQLGLGHTFNQSSPQLLPSSSPWISFGCGHYFTIGVTTNETLVWGYNCEGELGLGDQICYSSPQLLPSPSNHAWVPLNSEDLSEVAIALNMDTKINSIFLRDHLAHMLRSGESFDFTLVSAKHISVCINESLPLETNTLPHCSNTNGRNTQPRN